MKNLDFIFFMKCIGGILGYPPNFQTPTISTDVLETLTPGGLIASVKAYDADDDPISYSLVSVSPPEASELFNVAVTGEVTTKDSLDFETRDNYVVVVRATSNGGESAEQTIMVNVINVNEVPVFESNLFGVTVTQGLGEGSFIAIASATDPDNGTALSHTFTGGNEAGDFTIGTNSGLVMVAPGAIMNYTITNAYALIIEAYDNGIPPKTGTTTLIVAVCSGAASSTSGLVLILLMTATMYDSESVTGII